MNGTIPKLASWCTTCRQQQRCEHHVGGADYDGPEAYAPSNWVNEVFGTRYVSYCSYDDATRVWVCDGYDPRSGFWMRTVDDAGPPRVTNISERAVGRTWHELEMTCGAWWLLEALTELGRMPTESEAHERGIGLGLATVTLTRFGFVAQDGTPTVSGVRALSAYEPETRVSVARVKVDAAALASGPTP